MMTTPPYRSLLLIQRDSMHQSVTESSTIQPLGFSCNIYIVQQDTQCGFTE